MKAKEYKMKNSDHEKIKADNDKLRAFASDVLKVFPDGGSWDALDIQEMAVNHGLLMSEIRKESCAVEGVSSCKCEDYCSSGDFDLGVECFRKTYLVTKNGAE